MRSTDSNGAFLVWSASPGSEAAVEAAAAYAQIAEALSRLGLRIVQERIFGSLSVEAAIEAARQEALGSRGILADGPRSYIEGRPVWGEGFAGVLMRAAAGHEVRTIREDGIARGHIWQTDGARYLILQDVQAPSSCPCGDDTPPGQVRCAIERADRILRMNGAGYRDTVRTWFYVSNILGWYDRFNESRNAEYGEFGLMPSTGGKHALPASTGIGAGLAGGIACSLDLLAVTPVVGAVGPVVSRIANPRQQEAFRYGSAFSRCTIVRGPRENLIEVSGTAAIDEHGRSLWPGDVRGQARCTLEKTASLLERIGASLHDITAASIFLKHGDDAEAVREVLAEMGMERLPAVWVEADVCREELQFEIDAEAVVPRHSIDNAH
ncbi:MAG: hypothetical protein HY718_09640 [Planctomycetes bacterium]|nr:hypothetical protein [Planctomycetota bacterium]